MITSEQRRRDFPSLGAMTYLNTAAESIPPACVHEALETYWRDKVRGMKGRDAHYAKLEECRAIAARTLRLTPAEVSFCSCSAEAYNLLATALHLQSNEEVIILSTHKWVLGIHGGCIISIPSKRADRLTTRAGGWFHLANAFEADRFERVVPRVGAASYSVGMPNFAAVYALDASLRYLESIGAERIAAQADPLAEKLYRGLLAAGGRLRPKDKPRRRGIPRRVGTIWTTSAAEPSAAGAPHATALQSD